MLAFPETSGTPRPGPPPGFPELGTPAPACQSGMGKYALTPPPVATAMVCCWPFSFPVQVSFQVFSLNVEPLTFEIIVPPHEVTQGSEAGKSTYAYPFVTPLDVNVWPPFVVPSTSSSEPQSPDALKTVTPIMAADWNASSTMFMLAGVQSTSGLPQDMEMTEGLFALSLTAAVIVAIQSPPVAYGPYC